MLSPSARRSTTAARLVGLVVSCLSAAACTAGPPHVSPVPDSGMGQQTLAAPVVDPLPTATDLGQVPVSGVAPPSTSGMVTVVVTGGASSVPTTALPGGRFCAQVPLTAGSTNLLSVYALAGGLTSPSTQVAVLQDPTAPTPPLSQQTCNGEPVPDGGLDCRDPMLAVCAYACNACPYDAYQPNSSPQQGPSLNPGSYPLQICPCHDEWFALVAPAGAVIDATVSSPPGVQVQLELHRWYGSDGGSGALASSNAQGELRWPVDGTARYDLRIFSTPDGGGSYTLTLNDFTNTADGGAGDAGGGDAGSGDAGPPVYGPCSAGNGPGADPTECNSLTPYCDVNRTPPACVSGATDTVGESCATDTDCNLGLTGTQAVCTNAGTCAVGFCHVAADCPASTPTCSASNTCTN